MTKRFGFAFFTMSVAFLSMSCGVALATEVPVDVDIAALRHKADHLEKLKQLLGTSQCAVTVDGNTVALQSAALRSEGLVMAIGDAFPGNYLAFHRAPKPEFLANVVDHTFRADVASHGVSVVTARLEYSEADKVLGMVASVNFVQELQPEMTFEEDGETIVEPAILGYDKTTFLVGFGGSEHLQADLSTTTADGHNLKLVCK